MSADSGARSRRRPLQRLEARVGLVLGAVVFAIVVFGPLVAPFPPTELVGSALEAPSSAHVLGTDALGRDVLSRVLSGGRTLVIVSILAVVVSQVVGGGLAMLGAYFGGWVDAVVARTFDVFLTLPPLLLVLVLIAGLGLSDLVLVFVVSLVFMPRAGRIVRVSAEEVLARSFVEAARARGEHPSYVLFREVIPNMAGPVVTDLALRVNYALIFVATLGFLGLGVDPPAPDWGVMVGENRATIAVAPVAVLAPALAIALSAISVNLVADALTAHWSRETEDRVVGL